MTNAELREQLAAAQQREQALRALATEKGWGYFFDARYDAEIVKSIELKRQHALLRGALEKLASLVREFAEAPDDLLDLERAETVLRQTSPAARTP